MLGVTTTWRMVFKGHGVRKVENYVNEPMCVHFSLLLAVDVR